MKIVRKKYPNGGEYLEFLFNDQIIGHAALCPEGYLVFGKRKPVFLLKDAILQIIRDHIRKHKTELVKWSNIFYNIKDSYEHELPAYHTTKPEPTLPRTRLPAAIRARRKSSTGERDSVHGGDVARQGSGLGR
jgi:hypothetical protein